MNISKKEPFEEVVLLKNKITELEQKIKDLESAIASLDKLPNIPYPNIPYPNTPWTIYPEPFVNNKCSKCGLDLSGTIGYVCPNPDCPSSINVNYSTEKTI